MNNLSNERFEEGAKLSRDALDRTCHFQKATAPKSEGDCTANRREFWGWEAKRGDTKELFTTHFSRSLLAPDRLLCSDCGLWAPAGKLTVTDTKWPLDPASGACAKGDCTRCCGRRQPDTWPELRRRPLPRHLDVRYRPIAAADHAPKQSLAMKDGGQTQSTINCIYRHCIEGLPSPIRKPHRTLNSMGLVLVEAVIS